MNRKTKLQTLAAKTYINNVPRKTRKRTDKLIPGAKKTVSKIGGFFSGRSAKGRETVMDKVERITFGKPVKRKKRRKKR